MRNRWFSPRLQRFISEDPIGLRGGINQYEYANGNPIGLRDPSGLDPCFYNPGSKWDEDSNGPIGVSDCSLIGTTYTVDARLFAGGIEFNSPSDMSDREEPYRKRSQTNDETQYAVPAASVEPPSLGQCAAAHYDIESGALQAFLVTPIPKAALGVPTMVGSSPFTNAISAIGHFLAPGLRMPFKVMGTSRVFGALGRIGVVAGVGMLAFDATSIGLCASRYGL